MSYTHFIAWCRYTLLSLEGVYSPAPQHRTLLCSTLAAHHRHNSWIVGRTNVQTRDKRIVVSTNTSQSRVEASVEEPGTRKVTPQVCKFNDSSFKRNKVQILREQTKVSSQDSRSRSTIGSPLNWMSLCRLECVTTPDSQQFVKTESFRPRKGKSTTWSP